MHVVTLCLSISLLFCGVVGLQDGNRARDKAPLTSQVLCPSYPYPVVEPSAMQQILAPFLEDVGNKMSAELKTTPGGAVVSLVYRDTVIWTYGYGAINMSGKQSATEICSYSPAPTYCNIHSNYCRSLQRPTHGQYWI